MYSDDDPLEFFSGDRKQAPFSSWVHYVQTLLLLLYLGIALFGGERTGG